MKLSAALASLAALIGLWGCVSAPAGEDCDDPGFYGPAAAYNRAAETNLPFSPFGRPETGWAVYAPAIGREVASACPAESAGFARAVARWQRRRGLTPHGGVDSATFLAMKAGWEQRRPFVRLRASGVCPEPPNEAGLVTAPAADSYRGSIVRLRPAALAALEQMLAAARAQAPAVAADPELLTAFSGYRSPTYDAGRCAREQNCNGIVRAACSAHRTGLAVDLNLGAAPGFEVDSSDDANRLYLSKTPAYRWLVANAGRFGFVNYPFEPWHWEWTGEAP